jgi:hypothetical protein
VIGDDGEAMRSSARLRPRIGRRTDMSLMHLERARNLDEAVAIIAGAGDAGAERE